MSDANVIENVGHIYQDDKMHVSSPPRAAPELLLIHTHTHKHFPFPPFTGTAADARELSTGDIRSDVRVLAAQRVESPQLPGNTSISTAQESRLQAQHTDADVLNEPKEYCI